MQFVGSIAFASMRGGQRQDLGGGIGAWRVPTNSALQRHIQTIRFAIQPFFSAVATTTIQQLLCDARESYITGFKIRLFGGV